VLKEMGALPSERRVMDMTDGDYLYCILNLLLDQEEQLNRLCPQCRRMAEEGRCPSCGAVVSHWQGGENEAFDEERFRALSEGKTTR
jgi:predicted amidophosphoribosyltransferase